MTGNLKKGSFRHRASAGIMVCLALCAFAVSCSQESREIPAPSAPMPQIVVMYAPGGLGDQGYNDCILSGVQSFKKAHHPDADMYQYSPGSVEEAERLFADWLSLPESNVPALFVAASSDYEKLVGDCLKNRGLTANKQVLLFESDNEERLPVTTFHLSMAGASYLAGVTAATHAGERKRAGDVRGALVVLAHPGDRAIAAAAGSFSDGFRATLPGVAVETEYLAADWSGYVSARTAYQNMERWSRDYGFVFPVAGGSNSGIYRYTREYPSSAWTAGMDTDCSAWSRNVIGSVIKRVDLAVCHYLETWLSDGTLPASAVYGLRSGYTDWLLSPLYGQYRPVVEAARAEAVRLEEKKETEIMEKKDYRL